MRKTGMFILFTLGGLVTLGAESMESAGKLEEVVIKGEEEKTTSVAKPFLKFDIDPYETIRDSLNPDPSLLLVEVPLTFAFRYGLPALIQNERVIQPWKTGLHEDLRIRFHPLKKLSEVVGKSFKKKEAAGLKWRLTLTNEEGKEFQRFEGKGNPPEEFSWAGKNDSGVWISPGHSYSAVYRFTKADGSVTTGMDAPLRFPGLVHTGEDGLIASLASSVLFGPTKQYKKIALPEGEYLLQTAADWIKRYHPGAAIRVMAYAKQPATANIQAETIREALAQELMILPENIALTGDTAPFAEERIDLLLLHRHK